MLSLIFNYLFYLNLFLFLFFSFLFFFFFSFLFFFFFSFFFFLFFSFLFFFFFFLLFSFFFFFLFLLFRSIGCYFFSIFNFTTISNKNISFRFILRISFKSFNFFNYIHSFNNLSKNNMFFIKPRSSF